MVITHVEIEPERTAVEVRGTIEIRHGEHDRHQATRSVHRCIVAALL